MTTPATDLLTPRQRAIAYLASSKCRAAAPGAIMDTCKIFGVSVSPIASNQALGKLITAKIPWTISIIVYSLATVALTFRVGRSSILSGSIRSGNIILISGYCRLSFLSKAEEA